MRKLTVFILLASLLLSLFSCGEYIPAKNDTSSDIDTDKPEVPDSEPSEGPEDPELSEDPFTVTVMLGGEVFTPELSEESPFSARWSDGASFHTAPVGENGVASITGLDGDYRVTLVNVPEGYTFDPNATVATNDKRSVAIELVTLVPTRGTGASLYNSIVASRTGVYRVNVKAEGKTVFYEFKPTRAGVYCIESRVDVSANMYNPILDVYIGTSAWKQYDYTQKGGGAASDYTENFKYIVRIDEAFIGNVFTFGMYIEGKDISYPATFDFSISYMEDYKYDWIFSELIMPQFIPNFKNGFGNLDIDKWNAWYQEYIEYLAADRESFGDSDYVGADVRIGSLNVFDSAYYKLNEEDGYYHVYNEEKYASTGGWGPILYASVSVPCSILDMAFNEIEYAGNKDLTLSEGTENYKLFIEGYDELIKSHGDMGPYFCTSDCHCSKQKNGMCSDASCTSCTPDCRHADEAVRFQKGYADIAIDGRCPVTEELKEFLQKYSVSQRLFSDGNGHAETGAVPYDAYEDSQWLFACGYYTD